MAFQGYLYKFGTTELPLQYIAWEGVNATPDQRTEAKAWTNAQNKLIRSTYSKFRSKLEITFREGLTDTDVANIFQIMRAGQPSGQQAVIEQKYTITYWNDKTGAYKTGTFYMVDPSFQYKQITPNKLIYKSFKLSFIEY